MPQNEQDQKSAANAGTVKKPAPKNEDTAEKKLEEMTAEELKKKAEEEIKEK